MKPLDNRETRVGIILDKLTRGGLSSRLRDLIHGWLLSDDSRREKEQQLAERFDAEFSCTAHPSREARNSYRTFARKHDLAGGAVMSLYSKTMIRVAAVTLPLAIVLGGYLLWSDRDGQGVATVTVAANEAAWKEVLLADGSVVRVMPGSTMRHFTEPGHRYVELDGQAHFNVAKAKDAGDEFQVRTDHVKITVLGTEFSVDSRNVGNGSTVDLLHGSVDIEAGERRVVMKPGEHLRLNHSTGEVTVGEIALGERRYDRMPGLDFSGVPMMDVLARIERDFGVRFNIEGEIPPLQALVAGDLSDTQSLNDLLRKIQTLSGRFSYEIADNEVKITINK